MGDVATPWPLIRCRDLGILLQARLKRRMVNLVHSRLVVRLEFMHEVFSSLDDYKVSLTPLEMHLKIS